MPPIPNSDFAAASICVLSVLNQRDVHHHPDRVVGLGQHYRPKRRGSLPRQARSQRPPRENRRGKNLKVFEHWKRNEVAAPAGIGGGAVSFSHELADRYPDSRGGAIVE